MVMDRLNLLLIFTMVVFGCHQPVLKNSRNDLNENFKDENFSKYYYSLKFSENFIPLDANSQIIKKSDFFEKILNENSIPVKIDSNDLAYYKLVKANPTEYQLALVKALVDRKYTEYKMEGKMLPHFSFTGLDGKAYTSKNTYGKILVLKLWFIGCVPCVQEFPFVNKIADQYKDRNDIQFISLTFDKKEDLENFLKSNPLKYITIPDQKNYIVDSLEATSFPTHIIANKKGEVIKFTDTWPEMEQILKTEASYE